MHLAWPPLTRVFLPLQVKGGGSEKVPPLVSFRDLGPHMPPFLARNVGLMNYERPTPIQKFAIPFALAGFDLMCCAQVTPPRLLPFTQARILRSTRHMTTLPLP